MPGHGTHQSHEGSQRSICLGLAVQHCLPNLPGLQAGGRGGTFSSRA